MRIHLQSLACAVAATLLSGNGSVHQALAQTTVNGNAMALRSSGSAVGSGWRLDSNGYLGTYVTLSSPGSVSLTVNAQGVSSGGVDPRLDVVIGDTIFGSSVNSTAGNYNFTFNDLPAGTHFIRAQMANDQGQTSRALTINSLTVGSGATVVNSDTNALALDAANTYIQNYRRQIGAPVTIAGGLADNKLVDVRMTRNAFNFGGTLSGVNTGDSKNMIGTSPPAPGTEAYKFQQFINANFNTIVSSNAGKWASHESTQGNINMTLVDRHLDYALTHNMRARMHNLLWGSGGSSGMQQPSYVNALISSAVGGNATAKTNLSNAIANRINYYAGTNGNRSQKWIEVDSLNESLHNPSYWRIYGASGLADIHNQLASAIAATGSEAKIYLNEYNVLQFSPNSLNPTTGAQIGSDQYANWYRQHVEDVINAGGAVSGIGFQEYTNVTATGASAHSASTIQKALQNLSIPGLPLSMTEFGMGSGQTVANTDALGPDALELAMRMVYGTPQAETFMIWGWWDLSSATRVSAALLDNTNGNNTLTPMGQRWVALLGTEYMDVTPLADAFTTKLNDVAADSDGTVMFDGFYGDYKFTFDVGGVDVTIRGLSLEKGAQEYTIVPGDFDGDGFANATDIDLLAAHRGSADWRDWIYDLNDDQVINDVDLDILISRLVETSGGGHGTFYGDADLDGGVGGLDFTRWRLREGSGWAHGDFDGDGSIGGLDFTLWRTRPQSLSGQIGPLQTVPEPAAIVLMLLAAPGFCWAARRRSKHG